MVIFFFQALKKMADEKEINGEENEYEKFVKVVVKNVDENEFGNAQVNIIEKEQNEFKCGKTLTNITNLNKHVKSVLGGQKDNTCEICKKNFSSAYILRNHIKIVHEGQRKHKCEACGKSFGKSAYLNRH